MELALALSRKCKVSINLPPEQTERDKLAFNMSPTGLGPQQQGG